MSGAGDSSDSQPWRCLRAKPKCEHLAAQQLRCLEGVEVICPRVRHKKKTARGAVWFVEALFPGYIFARCDWGALLRPVLCTTGITGMVHFGDLVPDVPESVVEELRSTFSEDELVTIVDSLETGDSVEIAEGPLRGATAVVTRLLPARERVAVLLDFMGTSREVEVPLLQVLGIRDARHSAFPPPKPR